MTLTQTPVLITKEVGKDGIAIRIIPEDYIENNRNIILWVENGEEPTSDTVWSEYEYSKDFPLVSAYPIWVRAKGEIFEIQVRQVSKV